MGALGNLVGGPLLGERPKAWPFWGSGLVMTGLWLLLGVRELNLTVLLMLLSNLADGLIPTVVFAAPHLVSKHDGTVAPPTMAMVIVGEDLGIVGGPSYFRLRWLGIISPAVFMDWQSWGRS